MGQELVWAERVLGKSTGWEVMGKEEGGRAEWKREELPFIPFTGCPPVGERRAEHELVERRERMTRSQRRFRQAMDAHDPARETVMGQCAARR